MANKAINDLLKYGVKSWVRPVLTSNGTLGGSSFAVSGWNTASGQPFYVTVNGNSEWYTPANPAIDDIRFIFYFPHPIMLSSFFIKNAPSGSGIGGWIVYSSNDGSAWEQIASGYSPNTGANATWNSIVNSSKFCKYYSWRPTSRTDGSYTKFQTLQPLGLEAF